MILTYQIVQSEPVKTFLKNQDYSKRTLSAIKWRFTIKRFTCNCQTCYEQR